MPKLLQFNGEEWIEIAQKGEPGESITGPPGTSGKDGSDGSPDTATDIRNKLSTLKGSKRLDKSAIKGIEDLEQRISDASNIYLPSGGGSGSGGTSGGLTAVAHDATMTGDGTVGSPLSVVGAGAVWGAITGTLSDQTDLQTALNGKAPSLGADDNYVTDAQLVVITNTSGANTGDQVADGVTITGTGTIGNPFVAIPGGSGDVVGPSSAVNTGVAVYNGTTGKLIKDSSVTLVEGTTGFTMAGGSSNNRTLTMQGNVTFGTTMTFAGGGAGVTITMPGTSQTIVGVTTTDTLTNKSIALGTNTVTGTIAQFNTALTDGDFATGGGTATGTNTGDLVSGTTIKTIGGVSVLGSGDLALPSGSATTSAITQTSHGFAVNDVLKFTGTTYQKAQANNAANAEVVGIVTAVAGANDFTLTTEGYVSGLTALSSDTVYFLSDATAGLLTATEPTATGSVSKPLLKTVSTTTGYFNNWRGMEITASPAVLGVATQAELAAGTDNVKYATALGLVPLTNDSMNRQAIINGNFDVWQRGTSVGITGGSVFYLADRWIEFVSADGGTLPTLTRSRQILTPGDISNSYYYTRLTTNGAGTSLGVNTNGGLSQKIENGTRNLAGAGKTVTFSFYARSSVAGKRIGLGNWISYGTGGSPSANEFVLGEIWTLTSSWVKYTQTFNLNTLVGKTFGTNDDDFLQFQLFDIWGTTFANTRIKAGATAESYGGAGTIDIAQVQLCAGSVALPFQPKSYGDELRACQRYYQRMNTDAAYTLFGVGECNTTTLAYISVPFLVDMRIPPTTGSSAANTFFLGTAGSNIALTAISANVASKKMASISATVASGLTAGRAVRLTDGSGAVSGSYLDFSAEL